MTTKKTAKKKAAASKKAAAPAEEAQAPAEAITEEQALAAGAAEEQVTTDAPTEELEAAAPAEEAPAEEEEPAEDEEPGPAPVVEQRPPVTGTVMVLVGPNGAAGRIILNQVPYDGTTPRGMARADYERLKAQYDLREVEGE